LYALNQVYDETHGNFSSLLEVYRQMKAACLNISHIIRLLKIANKDIQSIEFICQNLKREQASLHAKNLNAANTFQQLSNDISEEYKTLNQYRASSREESLNLAKLRIQKVNLEFI
jgi:septal ring factor EnvC (AmiA/AmiB activator)